MYFSKFCPDLPYSKILYKTNISGIQSIIWFKFLILIEKRSKYTWHCSKPNTILEKYALIRYASIDKLNELECVQKWFDKSICMYNLQYIHKNEIYKKWIKESIYFSII